MAEGILRRLGEGAIEVHSAGTHPSRVNPLAIEAMNEIGIDISSHRSKSVDEFAQQHFDAVITVCDKAKESCPLFPGAPERIHWSCEDPAAAEGSHDEKLAVFRRVRDMMEEQVRGFVAKVRKPAHDAAAFS
jgi:arsenate reductase